MINRVGFDPYLPRVVGQKANQVYGNHFRRSERKDIGSANAEIEEISYWQVLALRRRTTMAYRRVAFTRLSSDFCLVTKAPQVSMNMVKTLSCVRNSIRSSGRRASRTCCSSQLRSGSQYAITHFVGFFASTLRMIEQALAILGMGIDINHRAFAIEPNNL